MSAVVMTPIATTDVAALAQRYDVFLVDQFGVLHDGQSPYPGAVEALSLLKDAGKKVTLISNSGKRAAPNEARLEGLGFDRRTWDLFLSSGEVAWRILAGRTGSPPLRPGTRCLFLARDDDRTAVEGLDLVLVESGEDAELVLLSGSEGDKVLLDHYRDLLAPAARAGVPCICTNPDKIMLTGVGLRFGPGAIGALYEKLGGSVRWIGKPHPEIYRAALGALGNPPASSVVAIGDSIEHDVIGARAAGISAALVRSGVLADFDARQLDAAYREHGAAPDYVLARFVWTKG